MDMEALSMSSDIEDVQAYSDVEMPLTGLKEEAPSPAICHFKKIRFLNTGKSLLVFAVFFCAILAAAFLLRPQRATDESTKLETIEATELGVDSDPTNLPERRKMGDKYTMSVAEAEELDTAAMNDYPEMLPMTPILYREKVESHDIGIAQKLHGLDRDSRIRLPDGKEIEYWQTIQYANRHFAIHATRFRQPPQKNNKKVFDVITKKERIKVWGVSGIFRKIVCHPDFLSWTKTMKFQEGATSDSVYARFEDSWKGTYIGIYKLRSAVVAIANGKGVIWNNKHNFLKRSFQALVATYAHEQAHNLGYSHQSKVPYPIGNFFKAAMQKKLYNYTVYDLAASPDFEVVNGRAISPGVEVVNGRYDCVPNKVGCQTIISTTTTSPVATMSTSTTLTLAITAVPISSSSSQSATDKEAPPQTLKVAPC